MSVKATQNNHYHDDDDLKKITQQTTTIPISNIYSVMDTKKILQIISRLLVFGWSHKEII